MAIHDPDLITICRILIIKIVCDLVYSCFTIASIMAVTKKDVYAILKSTLDLKDKQARPIPKLVQRSDNNDNGGGR